MSRYVPECDPKSMSENDFIVAWLSKENHEKFLSYLLPLLEQGKLKVKVRTKARLSLTEVDIHEKITKKYGNEDEKEYSLPSQAKDAIEDIRKRWTTVSEEDRSIFEEWGVLFTLPENEWPK